MTPEPADSLSPSSASSTKAPGADVQKYLANAIRVLGSAQTLCSGTSNDIESVKTRLAEFQKRTAKLRFLGDCVEQQAHFLLNTILKHNIGQGIIQNEWSENILHDLVDVMTKWQGEITSQIEHLSSIQNVLLPRGATHGGNEQPSNKMLSDYISVENANLLQSDLNEIPVIQKHMSSIMEQYDEMRKRVQEKIIKKRLVDIRHSLNSQFAADNSEMVLLCDVYTDQLSQLELDVVNFLGSLTAHFDKCEMLNNFIDEESNSTLDHQEFQELLQVVRNDDKDVETILDSLRDIVGDIEKFIPEIMELLVTKEEKQQSLHKTIDNVIASLTKNSEYLSVFADISDLIIKYKDRCLEDIEMIKTLREFYGNFEHSYENLIVEANRRKKTAENMKEIIKKCQMDLEHLDAEDNAARRKFLELYGNYLPEDIWPNEIDDFSPLYSLESSVREL
ncbi:protein kinase regulatory subunit [Maudiozyma humilis]|uniref:Autophagy-related protein 17 n=1 Tax=Maudiozyma humilis TaxID=51915 RepID=A0AAV5S2A3_MAUHU|nr:protein kinase regulatory subunit [Kazachstania humilis]